MNGEQLIRDIRIRFDLTASAAAVLRVLLSDGWEYRGSYADIAKAVGCSESTAKRGVRELQDRGLIVGRAKRGRHKKRYRVRREVIDGTATFPDAPPKQRSLPKPRYRLTYTDSGTELREVEPREPVHRDNEPVHSPPAEPVHETDEPVQSDPVEPVQSIPEPVHPHEVTENSSNPQYLNEGGVGGNRFTRWSWTTEQLGNAQFVDQAIVPMAIANEEWNLPNCPATIQGIQAAAVCALKHPASKNPPALFTNLVKRSAWKQRGEGGIAETYFDQAAALRRSQERAQPVSPAAQSLAREFSCTDQDASDWPEIERVAWPFWRAMTRPEQDAFAERVLSAQMGAESLRASYASRGIESRSVKVAIFRALRAIHETREAQCSAANC